VHYERLIAGYHGCDASVAEQILAGGKFVMSENAYDWLGRGVYFWEFGPDRALKWAEVCRRRDAERPPAHRAPVTRPAVVGAWIQLGNCFDLLDTKATEALTKFYPTWKRAMVKEKQPLPENKLNHLLRFRDCAVINTYLPIFEESLGRPCDTVRGCFIEGKRVYEGSGITREAHIQVAVRRLTCIVGVFRPTLRIMAKRSSPQQPVAPPSEAEAHRLALARVAKMSSAELLQRSVNAGVYTPDGKLTPEYGGKKLPYHRT
jgi:hypothetical protein